MVLTKSWSLTRVVERRASTVYAFYIFLHIFFKGKFSMYLALFLLLINSFIFSVIHYFLSFREFRVF